MMRLGIGGPTRDMVPASFAMDFAQLFAYTRERGPWDTVADLFLGHTYIHCGRELVLEAAVKRGLTHLLWLDTDMTFPRQTALQLFAHDQPIVGCNYLSRRQGSGKFTAQQDDGTPVPTTETSTGLESVGAVGFGCVLMRIDIVSRLHRPWFRHALNVQGGDVGEDIMFCRALREIGHTIYVDHDLSKEIGHVGTYTYWTAEKQSPVDVAC
jgi:hypothetical protein